MNRLQNEEALDDAGLTLIELLVAMMITTVLMAVTMAAVTRSTSAVQTTSQVQGLNEEARLAINRMARDLRQANSIVTAVDPDGPSYASTGIVAVRLNADFDGDGCIGGVMPTPALATACLAYNAANPEDITYCYEFSTRQLYVIDNQVSTVTPVTASTTSCSGGQPLLAGNVDSFKVEYRSNQYRYDVNPSDGVTTWRELDEAETPIGNANGQLDTVELGNVDSVVLNMTMKVSGHLQNYRTQVDLRNRSI
jgi:prepilin-type N-terminal cleavage/methylation domain-containing protein